MSFWFILFLGGFFGFILGVFLICILAIIKGENYEREDKKDK